MTGELPVPSHRESPSRVRSGRDVRSDSWPPRAVKKLRVRTTTFVQAASDGAPPDDVAQARAFDDGTALAVVADGLGGAELGGDAARRTVATYLANFRNRPRAWSTDKALEEITRHLNRQLHQEGLARFDSPELASTVVVVALDGDRLHLVNAGDSRCYRFRAGSLMLLSEDHRESGTGREHVLRKALGLANDLAPHIASADIAPGDVLLLCTDGLSDVVPEADLARLLADHASARALVAEARRRATPETLDDIAAVVLEVEEVGAPSDGWTESLPIPDTLKAGDVVNGFTLRRSFRASDRIWLAAKAGDLFVLKFAPLDARANEAVLTQFIRETWHATSLKADFFPGAFVPENATARYYALEYFAAPTLRQWLAEHGPLDTAEAVSLGRFLLYAAQFLLRHDFVHGDVKPENILVLGERGALSFKLIDLGSVAEVFSVNTRAGTPSFLAPERLNGAPVGERTEVYAIGVTLHVALTRAYPHGEIEPFQNPVFREARRPSRVNPHIPPWLDSVLLRAVAVDPERRYPHFSEMKFDLENPAKVKPFQAAGAPLLERNPLLFYKAGFFILLVVNLWLVFKLVFSAAPK